MEKIKIHHLCVSCNEGLFFRSRQDYIRFINNMAILANKYKIRILAFSVMSNHFHVGVMTDGYGPPVRISVFIVKMLFCIRFSIVWHRMGSDSQTCQNHNA